MIYYRQTDRQIEIFLYLHQVYIYVDVLVNYKFSSFFPIVISVILLCVFLLYFVFSISVHISHHIRRSLIGVVSVYNNTYLICFPKSSTIQYDREKSILVFFDFSSLRIRIKTLICTYLIG